ncbi:MAG: thioesterase domain-containing protein [Bdellovibrionaceae bacterium]|nr:thioesterase domain-containing protein [Pseudobdellovibrionaceae bacterium]
MNRQSLEARLHTQIPLSQWMGVRVVTAGPDEIRLECPLTQNHNHLGSAFGGSLSCLMILAGYCQAFQLMGASGHVVLKSNSTDYRLPVIEPLRAVCERPPEEDVQEFLQQYAKKGKARIHLKMHTVLSDGRIACSMHAEFVGIK